MELIMLIGIPGSGKTSFYREKYFNTHMRISLDLFNTRNKEKRFMDLAFSLQQRMILDNTNVTRAERDGYIQRAKAMKFRVVGYYFESILSVCLERNENRPGKEKIERVGVIAKCKALELPTYTEGFDRLYYISLENNEFKIKDWNDEI